MSLACIVLFCTLRRIETTVVFARIFFQKHFNSNSYFFNWFNSFRHFYLCAIYDSRYSFLNQQPYFDMFFSVIIGSRTHATTKAFLKNRKEVQQGFAWPVNRMRDPLPAIALATTRLTTQEGRIWTFML